ncbi:hypothetical protein ACA086_02665 [Muriicola sp. E247]|uniref:hypothetical protein n=1 Tax=Muriicola sp. E247 TaxID=3242730 RepID=UPI00352345C6
MTQLKMLQLKLKNRVDSLRSVLSLKAILVVGMILLGSCQSQEGDYKELEKNEAIAEFEDIVIKTTPEIKVLMQRYPQALTEKGMMMEERSIALKREARNVLRPVVNGTKALLKSYNVDEEFLRQEFKDSEDPRIALVGLMILAAESSENMAVASNFVNAFGTVGYAYQSQTLEEANKDWVDCLIVAVGIDVVVDFLKGNVTEAIAKKAIKKIASRALGVIGAAIAVYEFGSCMGYY